MRPAPSRCQLLDGLLLLLDVDPEAGRVHHRDVAEARVADVGAHLRAGDLRHPAAAALG